MGLNCGKGFLYFYNLIFLGISGALVYLSVLFAKQWGDYASLVADTVAIVPAGIILIAAIFVLIATIVGFCGVCHGNKCTLGAFISLLLFLLTVEIVAGCLTYVKKKQINADLRDNLKKSFDDFYDKHSTTRAAFERMQESLHCCGMDGPSDWNKTKQSIPSSCCIHQTYTEIPNCYRFSNNLYQKGCYGELIDAFDKNLQYICGVVIGFAVIQVVGIMMAIYLIVLLKKTGYIRMLDNNAAKVT